MAAAIHEFEAHLSVVLRICNDAEIRNASQDAVLNAAAIITPAHSIDNMETADMSDLSSSIDHLGDNIYQGLVAAADESKNP